MDKPRIQILIQRFYPVVGGMERQCQAVVGSLIAQGWDIKVWTQKPGPSLPRQATIDNIPVRRFGRGTHTHLSLLLSLLQIFFALLRNQHLYDIVHTYGAGHLAIVSLLASKITGKPVVIRPATYSDVTRYLQGKQSPNPTLLGRLYHADPLKLKCRLLQQVTHWVALTDEIEKELTALPLPPRPITRITNGVDTNLYKPVSPNEKIILRQQHHLPTEAIIYLFVGRFVPRKGILELLEAWEELNYTQTNTHLLLVGSGKDQIDSIETEVIKKTTSLSSVTAVGLTQNPVIYYQVADVLTFPSYREGMPNVLLEGMSCGLAPIATKIGGVTEIVTDGQNGIEIAPQNAIQLVQAMLELANNKEKRELISEAARQTIIERYSLIKVVQQYADLYQHIWQNRD